AAAVEAAAEAAAAATAAAAIDIPPRASGSGRSPSSPPTIALAWYDHPIARPGSVPGIGLHRVI
ncbi:MAG: hypothetical protein SFX72_22915, partial [Isosphaeraceae bacterium]|nr:hypothetical protein [Isosphaeraceae bacterium]